MQTVKPAIGMLLVIAGLSLPVFGISGALGGQEFPRTRIGTPHVPTFQAGPILAENSGTDSIPSVSPRPSPHLSPSEIYRITSPAVVTVAGFNEQGNGELGAGSLITTRGDVLTNAHVIMDKKTGRPFAHVFVYYKPAVVSGDPKLDLRHRAEARVERYDTHLDLALLRPVSPPSSGARLAFASSEKVTPGMRVLAIGNPESGGLWSMTEGIISTSILDFDGIPGKNVFQTDAGMNRGNSGGPLINSSGRLVGVDTAIARKSADGLAITSVNFSIKSDVVKRWIEGSGGWPAQAAQDVPFQKVAPPEVESPRPPSPAPSLPGPVVPPSPSHLHGLVTPAHPFEKKTVMAQEVEELEHMGQEMHKDIQEKLKNMDMQ